MGRVSYEEALLIIVRSADDGKGKTSWLYCQVAALEINAYGAKRKERIMSDLRERPIRLESTLTRDYINRAAKLRELGERVRHNRQLEPLIVGAGWLLVLGLLAYVAVNY